MRERDERRLEASLCLPADAMDLLHSSSSSSELPNPIPSWVLLDSLAYMVPGVRNHTTAQTLMPDGRTTIQVTFLVADPPRRSYWCISCTADSDDHQDQDQDLDLDDNPLRLFGCVPEIVSSAEHLALIQVGLTTSRYYQWFVYNATGPSLVQLPDILHHRALMGLYGIVPSRSSNSNNNGGFLVAALSARYGDEDEDEVDKYDYDLILFSSTTWTCGWTQQPLPVDYGWTRKPHCLAPNKVIPLGHGLLGWVDLWEGILVCDVANGAARFVPMPRPLPGNQDLYRRHDSPARSLRDVTFDLDDGRIRCVEIEQLVMPKPRAAGLAADPSNLLLLFDSPSPMVPDKDEFEAVGWRLVTWFRELNWGHWQRGTMLHSDQLLGSCCFSWKDLETLTPLLCADHDHSVYLTSVLKTRCPGDETSWMLAIDINTKSLSHQPTPFFADRDTPTYPSHITCTLTTYLSPPSPR